MAGAEKIHKLVIFLFCFECFVLALAGTGVRCDGRAALGQALQFFADFDLSAPAILAEAVAFAGEVKDPTLNSPTAGEFKGGATLVGKPS